MDLEEDLLQWVEAGIIMEQFKEANAMNPHLTGITAGQLTSTTTVSDSFH